MSKHPYTPEKRQNEEDNYTRRVVVLSFYRTKKAIVAFKCLAMGRIHSRSVQHPQDASHLMTGRLCRERVKFGWIWPLLGLFGVVSPTPALRPPLPLPPLSHFVTAPLRQGSSWRQRIATMVGVIYSAGRPIICSILFRILFNLTSSTLLHLGKASELALRSTSAAPHPKGASFFGSPAARNYSKLTSKLFKSFFLIHTPPSALAGSHLP